MDSVKSEFNYKGTILQRIYRVLCCMLLRDCTVAIYTHYYNSKLIWRTVSCRVDEAMSLG